MNARKLTQADQQRNTLICIVQDFYKAVYAMVRDDAESHGMGPRSHERRSRDYDRHDSPPRRRHSSRERSSRDIVVSKRRSMQGMLQDICMYRTAFGLCHFVHCLGLHQWSNAIAARMACTM